MNVEFQALPNCLANLRIEVEPDAVTKKRDEVTKQYTKYAKLPGFRAGKAPRGVVEKKFNSRDQRGSHQAGPQRRDAPGDHRQRSPRALAVAKWKTWCGATINR